MVIWTATDASGNISTAVQSVTIVDQQAPRILTCPSSVTVEGDANNQGLVPDFTPSVVASDNCGVTSITQSPIAGTLVNVGITTVTIFVRDAANNIGTCQTSYTVIARAQISPPANPVYVAFGCGSSSTTLTRPRRSVRFWYATWAA